MRYPVFNDSEIKRRYEDAREIYSSLGVDVSAALETLKKIKVSMHCWQGDDVGGFESASGKLTGGIMATGSFPGKAGNLDELRQDIDKAYSLIPGKHRLNLHAIYLDNQGKFVDRDEIGIEHFQSWVDWAKAEDVKLDFNPTFFSHEKSESGFTLGSSDESIRKFWIEHAARCRKIAEEFSKQLEDKSIVNYWVPDGTKDLPADRWGPRKRLAASYDEIFSEKISPMVKEAVEGKLFGIGSEAFVVGSNEFYLAYAISRNILPCMDMGHYHPTETIDDKLSAVLAFVPEVLLHVSRPVRWDSDHVVIFDDALMALAREIVRGDALNRVYLATDFFDASINRVGAWVTGVRSLQKALLYAMLEPVSTLKELEAKRRGAERLALMEECRTMPYYAVWDYFCLKSGVPAGTAWLNEIRDYEEKILSKRG